MPVCCASQMQKGVGYCVKHFTFYAGDSFSDIKAKPPESGDVYDVIPECGLA